VNPVKPPISPGDHGPLIADLHAALRAMIDNAYLNALAFTAYAQDVIQQGLPAESEAVCYGPATQLFVARRQGFIGAGDSSAILAASAPGSFRSGRQSSDSIEDDVEAVDGCGFHVDDAEGDAIVRLIATDTLIPRISSGRGERRCADTAGRWVIANVIGAVAPQTFVLPVSPAAGVKVTIRGAGTTDFSPDRCDLEQLTVQGVQATDISRSRPRQTRAED
jgi:hypothetical protein